MYKECDIIKRGFIHLFILLLVMIGSMITTYYALNSGKFIEGNPFMTTVSFPIVCFVHILIIIIISILFYYFKEKDIDIHYGIYYGIIVAILIKTIDFTWNIINLIIYL